MQLATPTALAVRRRPDGTLPFEGHRIALSISASDDLPRLGMDETHLHALYIELARHLLAAGATLLYGGDLRPGGFTDALIDLVLEHRRSARDLDGSVVSFLAWPESRQLSQHREASVRPQIVYRKLDETTGLAAAGQDALRSRVELIRSAGKPLANLAVADRNCLALNLTRMREIMNGGLEARIVLGGRLAGFVGTVPGIAEEAFLAVRGGLPLFVVGGFGGCAAAIADSIRSQASPGVRLAAGDRAAQLLIEHRKNSGPPTTAPGDSTAMDAFFRASGVPALRNELPPTENDRLFHSVHVPEIISLVMTGLTRVWR
jgi:hypothetical protein